MRIEVLYVPGCPNYQPAVERVKSVLASESLQVEICGVPVSSEAEAKGPRNNKIPLIGLTPTSRATQ